MIADGDEGDGAQGSTSSDEEEEEKARVDQCGTGGEERGEGGKRAIESDA